LTDRFIDKEGFHETPANGGEHEAVAIEQKWHLNRPPWERFVAAGQTGSALAGDPSSSQ